MPEGYRVSSGGRQVSRKRHHLTRPYSRDAFSISLKRLADINRTCRLFPRSDPVSHKLRRFRPHLRYILDDDLTSADVRPVPMVPPQDERAGDINAGVRAGQNTDQERKSEIVDFTAAENIEHHRGEENGSGGNNRPAERLVQRLVHHLAECPSHT